MTNKRDLHAAVRPTLTMTNKYVVAMQSIKRQSQVNAVETSITVSSRRLALAVPAAAASFVKVLEILATLLVVNAALILRRRRVRRSFSIPQHLLRSAAPTPSPLLLPA